MARVKPGWIAPAAAPTSRGRFLIIDQKYGAVAQKWPRKRGKAKSGYDYFRQKEFGIVARMAVNPVDLELQTAIEMVKGTTYVPRDVLMSAAYGRFYRIFSEDGFEWPNVRDLTNNPQAILDQLTETVGSIIIRIDIGWIGLDPGDAGQILTMVDGLPEWADPEPAPPPPGPGPTALKTAQVIAATVSNPILIPGQSLGPADPTRKIVAAIAVTRGSPLAARSITGVTMNGLTMAAPFAEIQFDNQTTINLFELDNAGALTGDFSIALSGAVAGHSLTVYSLTNLVSGTPIDGATASGANPSTTIETAANGIVIATSAGDGGTLGAMTWTGLNTDNDQTLTTITRFSAASAAALPADLAMPIGVSSTATVEGFAAISYA